MTLLAGFVWIPVVAAAVVAAAFLWRVEGRLGWSRALAATRLAAVFLLAAWGVIRGFDWLASGGGPLSWVGVTRDVGTSAAPLDRGLLRLGIAASLLFGFAVIGIARFRAPRRARMPLALVAVSIAALCAVLLGGVYASDPVAFAAAMPLDLAAVTPVFAIGIALALVPVPTRHEVAETADSGREAATTSSDDGAPAPCAVADPEALLKRAKLLEGAPTFQVDGSGLVSAEAPTAPADRIWHACGGQAGAAGCVAVAVDRVGSDQPGVMIGDLPAPTQQLVGDAVVATAIYQRAARVLILAAVPARARDRMQTILGTLRAVAPGPLVAGEGELRDVLARNLLPAATWLDLEDLAASVLDATTQRGHPWLRSIELVLLDGADRLAPIGATHMAFALRRLVLAFGERRASPAWCALGGGSSGSLGFVEESTMSRFEAVPLGAQSTASALVYVRPVRGDGESPAGPEIEARARALDGAGLEVCLETGVGGDAERRPGYHGDCSLAQIEDRDLAALFLARNHLAHRLAAPRGHLGIWWVHDTPLARFLLNEGALAGLEQRGELQSPRPVAGLENPYMAAAHIEAALREGHPDEAALRRAFGDRAVDQLLAGGEERRLGQRARFDPIERTIERSAILVASGARAADPHRETVTASFIEVRSSRSGEVLARVDRRVAPTRFYPHRVFRVGDGLYQVGGDQVASDASSLVVKPAPPSGSPTLPVLELELTEATWRGKPKQVQMGKLQFARGTAEVVLRESVSGTIPRGKGSASVKYPPVTVSYPTRATVILFAEKPSAKALRYAGAMTARLVPAHLLVEPEDVDVVAFPAGFAGVGRPALVFVDRHLGGIGVAAALDAATIHNLFRWTWGILYRCPCMNGCDKCTPPEILAAEPDKVGALKLLGG